MPYFYYIELPLAKKNQVSISPRMSEEWPPIGGERNKVVWKTETLVSVSKRHLDKLDVKYRKEVVASLTQEK